MIDKLGMDGLGGASVRVKPTPASNVCPSCKANLHGGLIFDTFMEQYKDEAKALETAKCYGATKTEGHWGREIAIYSMAEDRTMSYHCPDCGHEWKR